MTLDGKLVDFDSVQEIDIKTESGREKIRDEAINLARAVHRFIEDFCQIIDLPSNSKNTSPRWFKRVFGPIKELYQTAAPMFLPNNLLPIADRVYEEFISAYRKANPQNPLRPII